MIVAGIVGNSGTAETASLINTILSSRGKKVSAIDYKSLEELDSVHLKQYINELEKNGVDVLLMKIGLPEAGRGFFKELHLDAVIYPDKIADPDKDLASCEWYARDMLLLLDEKGVVIANEDDTDFLKFLKGDRHPVITYGFNSKASITTSSVGDMMSENGLMCCLQKPIPARSGLLIGPHEYRVSFTEGTFDTYNVLAAATFAIINGVEL